MNPSADDIAQACKKINAENIIILPNNKNIILSAEQSRMLVPNRNIFVLQTKDIPQGLAAVLSFNPEASLADNLKERKFRKHRRRTGYLRRARYANRQIVHQKGRYHRY